MQIKFSIIIPIYNNKLHYICSTINLFLKQIYSKFEIIIIDFTEDITIKNEISNKFIKQFQSNQIIYKKINCDSIYAAFNEGLKLAKNEWIVYADIDNQVQRYFLGVFAKSIIDNPERKIFYSQYQFVDSQKINWNDHEFSLEKLKQDNFISLYAYVHHKSLINELGNFDNSFQKPDKNFVLKQCEVHSPKYIDLFTIKIHENNIIANETKLKENVLNCHIENTIKNTICKQKKTKNSNSIVCYTCITGDYDELKMPYVMPKNIDFICFANYDKDFYNGWIIRKIPDEVRSFSAVKQQRLVKMLAHRWLEEYDVSIWIDGNIQVLKDINELLEQCNLIDNDFYVRKHPLRSCIYDEAVKCIAIGKDSKDVITSQMARYKEDNYPRKNGLVESGILVRNHNSDNCIQIENHWSDELMKGSCRDQLSFNYVVWKYNLRYSILDFLPKIDSHHIFRLVKHGKNVKDNCSMQPITIALCNYNTTDLTNACIQSIIKNSKLNIYKIVVLDNSDSSKLHLSEFNILHKDIIDIIDNTGRNVIDFLAVVKKYGGKSNNNHASLKHAYSIQHLIDICQTPGMILLDSDTIVKNDMTGIIDYDFLTVGQIQDSYVCFKTVKRKRRIYPMLQFFNIAMMAHFKLKYFSDDGLRIIGSQSRQSQQYDTGASFFEDIYRIDKKKNLIKEVNIFKSYINHLCGASWAKVHNESKFLLENQKYI